MAWLVTLGGCGLWEGLMVWLLTGDEGGWWRGMMFGSRGGGWKGVVDLLVTVDCYGSYGRWQGMMGRPDDCSSPNTGHLTPSR